MEQRMHDRNKESENIFYKFWLSQHTFRDRVRDLHCCFKEEWGGSKCKEKLKAETDKQIDGVVRSVAVDRDSKPESQWSSHAQQKQQEQLEPSLDPESKMM